MDKNRWDMARNKWKIFKNRLEMVSGLSEMTKNRWKDKNLWEMVSDILKRVKSIIEINY